MAQTSTKLTQTQLSVLHDLSRPGIELRYMMGHGLGAMVGFYEKATNRWIRNVHVATVSTLQKLGLIKVTEPESKFVRYKLYVLTELGYTFTAAPED